MASISPTIFSWISIFILIVIWTYFFAYSYHHQMTLPWGYGIILIGILVSGVGYQFYNNQEIVFFSIKFPLVVSLIGIWLNINNIRKQFCIKNLEELFLFIGIGLILSVFLGFLFITVQGTKDFWVDSHFTKTAFIIITIQAGAAEELLFRGYLLSYLRKYEWNSIFVIILQAVIFTFLHISLFSENVAAIFITFFVGATTGFLTWKNSNLVSSIVLHISFNLITVMWWLSTA